MHDIKVGTDVGADEMTDAKVKHRANILLNEAEVAVQNGELSEAMDYIQAARTLIDGLEHKLQQRQLKPMRSRRRLRFERSHTGE